MDPGRCGVAVPRALRVALAAALACLAPSLRAASAPAPPPASSSTASASASAPAAAVGAGLDQLSDAIEALSAQVSPSVVQIFASGYASPLEEEHPTAALLAARMSTGSGVLLDADGSILTNLHVVQGARRLQVVLATPRAGAGPGQSILKARGQRFGAQLIGSDRETDLAVVRLLAPAGGAPELAALPRLRLGDSDALRQGELVLAVGSPLGLANSATLGVVSNVARQLTPEAPMVYIQTDAPVNPGNSGGPLVNTQGEVVGINTFILSQSGGSEGLGFAIPSNIARNVYEQIRDHGRVRRGQIGVSAQSITPTLAHALGLPQEWGVVLADVLPQGPADQAGLRIGDVVTKLDGKVMENGRQFDVNLYQRPIGSRANVDVLRGGTALTVHVAVAERDGDPRRLFDMVRPEENLVERLGILGLDLDAQTAALLPPLRFSQGVIVAAISAGSPYPEERFQPGDVLYALNGQRVANLRELRSALSQLRAGQPAVFQLERQGHLSYVALELD